jgi:hypothetical protein
MQPIQPVPLGIFSWDRAMQAVELVRQRLLRATAALERVKIPYAVAGGHAIAAWVARVDTGAIRNTPDINILVQRADAEAVRIALVSEGFVPRDAACGLLFLDGPNATHRHAVQVFFASEKIKDDDLLPTPDITESQDGERFRVINLDALVRMKLTSYRNKDRMHLRDLLDVGLIDATWPSRFIPELASRLQQILDDPNG